MQLIRETYNNQLPVESYADGYIQVKQIKYSGPVILPLGATPIKWDIESAKQLSSQTLAPLIKFKPALILLGLAKHEPVLTPDLIGFMAQKGIGLEVMTNAAVCRTYNLLISEGRAVVAGLLI